MRIRPLFALSLLASLAVAGCGSKEEGVSDPNDPMIGQKAEPSTGKGTPGASPETAGKGAAEGVSK